MHGLYCPGSTYDKILIIKPNPENHELLYGVFQTNISQEAAEIPMYPDLQIEVKNFMRNIYKHTT